MPLRNRKIARPLIDTREATSAYSFAFPRRSTVPAVRSSNSVASEALMDVTTKPAQIRLTRSSPACWRITFDNPPLNLMGPEFVLEFRAIMAELETDEHVKVVVFDSAVDGFFLNHSDFLAKFEDLTSIP